VAVKIRLKRMGAKKRPFYRVVVADARSPRDGRFIESVGYYDPLKDPKVFHVDDERIRHWMSTGARPSDAVRELLERQGTLPPTAHPARTKTGPKRAPKPGRGPAVAPAGSISEPEPSAPEQGGEAAGPEQASVEAAAPEAEEPGAADEAEPGMASGTAAESQPSAAPELAEAEGLEEASGEAAAPQTEEPTEPAEPAEQSGTPAETEPSASQELVPEVESATAGDGDG